MARRRRKSSSGSPAQSHSSPAGQPTQHEDNGLNHSPKLADEAHSPSSIDRISNDEHDQEQQITNNNDNGSHRHRKVSSPSGFSRSINRGRLDVDELDGSKRTSHSHNDGHQVMSWYGVACICVALSILSLFLHLFAGWGVPGIPARYSRLVSVVAVLASAIAVPLTHGLAGVRRYRNADYKFFQPLSGGFRYVALQCVGWALYSLMLLGAVYIIVMGARSVATSVIASVGLGGVLAQMLVLVSLHFYASASNASMKRRESTQKFSEKQKAKSSKSDGKNGRQQLDEPQVIQALSTGSGKAGTIITVGSIVLSIVLESVSKSLSTTSHISLQSLLTSALLLGVPLTHILTGRKIHPSYSIFQPFQGGFAFVLLQALGWTLWVCAVLSSIMSIFLASKNEYVTGIISGAGVGGVISQAMVLLSLKYFDSQLTNSVKNAGRDRNIGRQFASSRSLISAPVIDEVSEDSGSDTDTQPKIKRLSSIARDRRLTKDSQITSLSKNELEAAYNDKSDSEAMKDLKDRLADNGRYTSSTRRLYDYASMELATKGIDVSKNEEPQTSLISLSLTQWREGLQELRDRYAKLDWHEIKTDIVSNIIVGLMYFVPIFGAMFAFTPFLVVYYAHHIWYIPPMVACLVAYYVNTFRGRPGFTGKRSWGFIRKNITLWSAFEHYFSANIIAVGKLSTEHGPYIVGFHPHGVYPLTTFWATRGPSFRKAYPGLEVDVCGASVMFSCPILREILLWAGGREVSAASIRHALHAKKSILLVPGGQREMLHSKADHRILTYVTKHKGFVRMAIETGSKLVPVLSLGETFPLENIQLPRLQSWFLEKTGVGWPVLPYGRWYSPIGNPFPITVIVGEAIEVPHIEKPSQSDIDNVHARYYDQVRQLYEKYKAEAGFPNQTLLFSNH